MNEVNLLSRIMGAGEAGFQPGLVSEAVVPSTVAHSPPQHWQEGKSEERTEQGNTRTLWSSVFGSGGEMF